MPVSNISDSAGSIIVASVRQKNSVSGFSEILKKAAPSINKEISGPGRADSGKGLKPSQSTTACRGMLISTGKAW